jgi:uncharacterized cupin superfamily protein
MNMSQQAHGFIRLSTAVDLPLVTTAFIKSEWVIEGEAREQGHVLYNNEERNVQVGYWECTAFRETIVFPYDELGIVLAGRLQLADEGGRSEIFEAGTDVLHPAGPGHDLAHPGILQAVLYDLRTPRYAVLQVLAGLRAQHPWIVQSSWRGG